MADTIVVGDSAPIIVNNREFGGNLTDEERYQQPEIPRIFDEIRAYLRTQSALLELSAEASRDQILEAYQDDLELLNGSRGDFVGFGKSAIRNSIIEDTSDSEIDEKTEKIWSDLEERIPEAGNVSLLRLPAEQAGKSDQEMLEYLQGDFENGIDRLVRRMSYWLQLLVEKDLIGIIEWFGEAEKDVCRYHYFRQNLEERVVERQKRQKRNREFGGDVMEDELRKQEFKQERHTHHVVDATPHVLDEYAKEVPQRVADFIESVPDWLMPHLQLVDGTITEEDIVKERVGNGVVVESEKIGEWVYSPAVTLGPFAMIGWSGTTLKREETTFYERQKDNPEVQEKLEARSREKLKEEREDRRRFWETVLWRALPILVTLGAVVFGIYSFEQSQNAEARAAYAGFVSKWSEQGERMTLHVGDKFTEVGNKTVYVSHLDRFNGSSQIGFVVLSDSISYTAYTNATPHSPLSNAGKYHEFTIDKGGEIMTEERYGSFDVRGMTHRPWKVHVLRDGIANRPVEERYVDVSITTK